MNADLLLSMFGLMVTSIAAPEVSASDTSIVGQWNCQMSFHGFPTGAVELNFKNNGQCQIGNRQFNYTLANNTLQISIANTSDYYNYQLDKDILQLNYRDGSTFHCVRQASSSAPEGTVNTPNKTQSQTAGNEWQLKGTFCHYSGSSSYNSSYSSTSKIVFDGQGHWSMGSESSFSGSAGSAYSGGGIDNSGTYRIAGSQIFYTTRNGDQGVARVNMQQRDGRITEIYLGKDLYSPTLCN